ARLERSALRRPSRRSRSSFVACQSCERATTASARLATSRHKILPARHLQAARSLAQSSLSLLSSGGSTTRAVPQSRFMARRVSSRVCDTKQPPCRLQTSRKGPRDAARCERRFTARGRRSRWFTRRETSARPAAGAVPFGPAITSPQPRAARPGRGGPAASRSTRARRRRRHTGPFPSSPHRGMVPPMTNLFSIDGKVALVTGGSRGIGLMIARGFVEAGARTYISSRKADVCDQVAAELSRQGTCVSLPADLSSEAGARSLADTLARRETALHVLVNNAGANWGASLAEYPDSAWDKVLALNLKAVFHLTRTCLPLLERGARPGDPARVINIGSIDGLQVPSLETYAYSSSKAAVHHLTRVLAHRLAPQNITVNAIAPG